MDPTSPQEHGADHNLYFLEAVEQYRTVVNSIAEGNPADIRTAHIMARDLFVKFMTPASMYEVDVPMGVVRAVRQQVCIVRGDAAGGMRL